MATVHEESRVHLPPPVEAPAGSEFEDDRSNGDLFRPSRSGPPRAGGSGRLLVLLVLLAGIAAAVYFAWPQIRRLFGSEEQIRSATHVVHRDRLRVLVTEDGNVESASNIEVKCRVAGGSTILWIVQDGTIVEEGEEVVRLDQAALEEQSNSQKGIYETALAAHIKAREDFEAAKIGVREYQEGTYQKELQLVESQITVAQQNLRSAQDLLEHTERMVRKNYVTPLQLEADQFAVKRAGLDLEAAQIAKRALVEFTGPKTVRELESARDAAEAMLRSATANLELEKGKLDRLEEQLKNCVITAPQSGMVVYANERSRWGSTSSTIEEGAAVRDRQNILRIPDLTNMQVKVTVHESKVDQIRLGMPAEIRIGDRPKMTGKVISIANQPESTSFFQAAVKEYATIVKIDGETSGLKPGMTAIVQIQIADLRDVLTVPVSAVVEQNRQFYAWVKTPQGPERRLLLMGMTNDRLIEIKDGVQEGEEVYLNPRIFVKDLGEPAPAEESQSPADGAPSPEGLSAPGDSGVPDPQAGGRSAGGVRRGADEPAGGEPGPGSRPGGGRGAGGPGGPRGPGGGPPRER